MSPSNNARALQLAELISFLTHPALVVVVSLALITARFASSTMQFVRWTAIAAFLLVGPSALYAIWSWWREGRIDIDISRRQDRIVPMMITSLGALFGSYLVQTRLNNHTLLLLSEVLVAMAVSLTIVTLVWKISLHVATLTATVTLLVIFGGRVYGFLYLFLLPLGWARIYLKQHTFAQVMAGSLAGLAVTYLASILFRS